ncbi:MAG: PrsW family glutamic-type intramembrane protease [Minisyncoccia bacterium]
MSYLYTAPLLIIFGFLPSLIWLFYYLRKDCHPEPKSMIARAMFVGILLAPLAIIAELLYSNVFNDSTSAIFFLWAALIEEFVKYLAVRWAVINNPNFDEPIDAMIYMISAGLGFAAIENILVLFHAIQSGAGATAQIWLLRFTGATLLHAVSSALLGYFLALSWFYDGHSKKILALGFGIAILAHFAFNETLLSSGSDMIGYVSSSAGLLALIFLISFLFNKLKKRMAENQI